MKKTAFILALILTFISHAQTLTTSNLPIVIINTPGSAAIPDEPKIGASMAIINNANGVNNVTDTPTEYNGNIGIETRGNSTQDFEKKTYSIELRTNTDADTSVNLMQMGKEEDWILHAMVIDKSQVRIPLTNQLMERMGHYAPEGKYVEVILNGNYRGTYLLMEKIKRDDDRVDIAKLQEIDISGDEVTGGYILRIDWLDEDETEGFQSNHNSQGNIPMTFQWYYPKANNIQPQQATYIQNWMAEFEEAFFTSNYTNSQNKPYTDYIKINTFTDFLIINELSKNSDGYKLSSYVHKEKESKGGRLRAGPIWDFDQTYGHSDVCSNSDYTGWTYLQNQDGCEDLESMPMWWQRFMGNDIFKNRLKCRWETLRQGPLHRDSIFDRIDADTAYLSQALSRNFQRWDFLGQQIWAQPQPIPSTYAGEIILLKTWIANRLDWMDANMPGDCSQDTYVGVNELNDLEIELYPNPAQSYFNISAPTNSDIVVYNSAGQIIFAKRTTS